MALSIKERYARIDTSKLPDKYKSEFEAIKDDTENFDPELVDIFQDNFDKLYSLTEKNYPDAIKKPGKIKKIRPSKVKRPVAKSKKDDFRTMISKATGIKDKNELASIHMKMLNTLDPDDEDATLTRLSDKEFNNLAKKFAGQSTSKKEMVHKSRGKAKFVPRSRGKKKPAPDVNIDECRKIFAEAGYEIKKKPAKSGTKVMKVKVQRQERTIIKDKVDDTFKTILKDVSGSKEKDEKYDKMQKALSELQELMTKLFSLLNNLAEDNSIEKVEKIISLMKKLVP